jgi:hypothetical protein
MNIEREAFLVIMYKKKKQQKKSIMLTKLVKKSILNYK